MHGPGSNSDLYIRTKIQIAERIFHFALPSINLSVPPMPPTATSTHAIMGPLPSHDNDVFSDLTSESIDEDDSALSEEDDDDDEDESSDEAPAKPFVRKPQQYRRFSKAIVSQTDHEQSDLLPAAHGRKGKDVKTVTHTAPAPAKVGFKPRTAPKSVVKSKPVAIPPKKPVGRPRKVPHKPRDAAVEVVNAPASATDDGVTAQPLVDVAIAGPSTMPKTPNTGARSTATLPTEVKPTLPSTQPIRLPMNEWQGKPDKPPYSFASLLGQAITHLPGAKATRSSIFDWIAAAYPFYQDPSNEWQVCYDLM